jgi:ribosomal protein L33
MLQNFSLSSLMRKQNMLERLSLQKYFALSNVLIGAKLVAAVAILTNRYLRKINRKKMLQNFTLSSLMWKQNMLERLSLQKYFALSNILKGAKQGAAVAICTNRYSRKINRKKILQNFTLSSLMRKQNMH